MRGNVQWEEAGGWRAAGIEEGGTAMCFRPSSMDGNRDMQQTTCPTCGMPVAAEPGVTLGTCPYCGDPIPPDSPDIYSDIDPSHSTRIL